MSCFSPDSRPHKQILDLQEEEDIDNREFPADSAPFRKIVTSRDDFQK